MDKLHVSESFYSVQGEGQTMGVPAVFLRLSGCNLLCQSDKWVCDTIEVWRDGVATPFDEVLHPDWIGKLKSMRTHLVITGGEPLLHQKKIMAFLEWFADSYGFKPIVEIETNGTIVPANNMFAWVDYWNVSPKLPNSGETAIRRINIEALKKLSRGCKSIFKFVISEPSDIGFVFDEYIDYIDVERVVLMPAGESQEQLAKTRLNVLDLCMKYQFRYCDRLHIVAWNKKTGV